MIVRILGEGQLEVPGSAADALNVLDQELEKAVSEGDEVRVRSTLTALLDRVRALGTPVAADSLAPSDLIVPHDGASLEEIRALLTEDGFLPG
jgi:hypothetical protein